MQSKRRPMRLLTWAMVLCLMLTSTGCSQTHLEDIVGRWVAVDGAVLVFDGSGSFVAQNLKNELFDGYQRPGPTHSGNGTWGLLSGEECVKVVFDALTSTSRVPFVTSMYCSSSLSRLRIYFIVGDPDSHDFYYFEKRS